MEKVLIVGNGAREHALGWSIKTYHKENIELYFTGHGNAGTGKIGQNLSIDHFDFAEQVRFCKDHTVTFVIPGGENVLAAGAVDFHRVSGNLTFGPTQSQTQLESSKYFSARFNDLFDIPQPKWASFTDIELAHLEAPSLPFKGRVYKGDLLAGGTAVILPKNLRQEHQAINDLMNPDKFHGAGTKRIIVQERIEDGFEITAQCLTDGQIIVPLPEVMDFKKRFNEDFSGHNPNTGSKGSVTPVPLVTPKLRENIYKIQQQVLFGMKEEGLGFSGVINLNLKIPDEDNPKVLEINVRFGDPEFEALAMLINFDLLAVLKACCTPGQLQSEMVKFRPGFGVSIVLEALADSKLPDAGRTIEGSLKNYSEQKTFHSRTKEKNPRHIITTGVGRILNSSAWGKDLPSAIKRAEYPLSKKLLYLGGSHFRTDLGSVMMNT